jgi:hypothetical protein
VSFKTTSTSLLIMLTKTHSDYRTFKIAYEDAYQHDLAAYLVRSLPIKPDVLNPVTELKELVLPDSMLDDDFSEEPTPLDPYIVVTPAVYTVPIRDGGPAAWLKIRK